MTKPKIAFFINALSIGGAEKVLSELIAGLHDEFEIHLILLRNKLEFPIPLEKIHLHIFNHQPPTEKGNILLILEIPLNALRLKKYLQKNNIHLCFSLLNRPNFTSCFSKLLGWKGKVLISERSNTAMVYPASTLSGKLGRWLVRRLYPKADLIIPNAHGIETCLRQDFGLVNAFRIIHNPINIDALQTSRSFQVSLPSRTGFVFCSVGRLQKIKNHALLLQAAAQLLPLDFNIWLVGDGPERKNLEDLGKQLGLEQRVHFLGAQAHVAPFLQASNAFVLPSDFEGFPNALLEAMACKLPVISTDCPSGPGEILPETYQAGQYVREATRVKNGILVPVGDAAALSAAMRWLMDDPQLCSELAIAAQQRAMDFNRPVVLQQFRELFLEYGTEMPTNLHLPVNSTTPHLF